MYEVGERLTDLCDFSPSLWIIVSFIVTLYLPGSNSNVRKVKSSVNDLLGESFSVTYSSQIVTNLSCPCLLMMNHCVGWAHLRWAVLKDVLLWCKLGSFINVRENYFSFETKHTSPIFYIRTLRTVLIQWECNSILTMNIERNSREYSILCKLIIESKYCFII